MPVLAAARSRWSSAERAVRSLLARADIEIGGSRPWDVEIRDPRVYDRVLSRGTLGLGEAYMDGWWDCERLDELVSRALRADLRRGIALNAPALFAALRAKVMNLQTERRATTVARTHYDLGNDLFASFLDPWMQYSCAYFKGTDSLAEAQEKKLDLIARKLGVKEGDRVLDIGCGWGGLAKYLAERHGCVVTGVNISERQIAFARDWCRELPVTIMRADYREIRGSFDKVVSVGMFEHVGPKNYKTYMETAARCLRPGGVFLLHTIGADRAGFGPDPWISKYIFQNSVLPAAEQISRAARGAFAAVEDWHEFGTYYASTLRSWHRNFVAAWPRLSGRYGERFRRMWEYYLLTCAGAFGAGANRLWQVVLSQGLPEPYVPSR